MNIKIFSSMFFYSLLLLYIPANVYAEFTYDSCMPEYGKTKMIKNNSDGSRIYCVSIETAKILEQRGWGTSDYNYFHTIVLRYEAVGGLSRLAGGEYSIDENYSDAFIEIMDSCHDWIKKNVYRNDPTAYFCNLTFYNGTILNMDMYGHWVDWSN